MPEGLDCQHQQRPTKMTHDDDCGCWVVISFGYDRTDGVSCVRACVHAYA